MKLLICNYHWFDIYVRLFPRPPKYNVVIMYDVALVFVTRKSTFQICCQVASFTISPLAGSSSVLRRLSCASSSELPTTSAPHSVNVTIHDFLERATVTLLILVRL